MAETIPDITHVRGDTFQKTLTFLDKQATPQPIDITGGTITFTIKAKPKDTDAEAIVGPVMVSPPHTDPTNGETQITIPKETMVIPAKDYHFDFQFDSAAGIRTTLKIGVIRILQDVTHNA